MKKLIDYNFNEYWNDGSDFIRVNFPHFIYEIDLEDSDLSLDNEELKLKYRDKALSKAAYKSIINDL